jgi:23S rRNA (cytosine1962-C5)-methyltransferase
MSLPDVVIDQAVRSRIQQGHPWVYRDHVRGGERLRSGQWVRARCGGLLLYGLWDAQSPIALRIFSRHDVPTNDVLAERVWQAWENRAGLRAGSTTCYRWIYGEGDGIPGLIVDRYGDYAVMQIYAESIQAIVMPVARALQACDPDLRGVVLRERTDPDDAAESESSGRIRLIHGELPPNDLVVQEHGLYLQVNLYQGQKTGLFLDQRENRRTVEQLAGGLTVLNCFAYTGGFSLYALRGNAAHVTSVDIGKGLAEATATNLRINQLPAEQHSYETEDCFSLLDNYARAGRSFQLVILDPPSFARNRNNSRAALRAYTRLNVLALRVLAEGGLLVSASCTSQIGPEQFRTMLADAAMRSERWLQIIHEAGQPIDHPVPVGFPEGRYLKFVVARALPNP